MIVLELEVIKETPQKRITLVRELDKKITDIVDDSKNSKIIYSRIKEFKDI